MTATDPASFEIRPERADDSAEVGAIAEVVSAAFGSPVEAALVDGIRASEYYQPTASLVAVSGGTIIGHVMLSDVALDGPDGRVMVSSLSPLSVAPDWQRRGVGAALVEAVMVVAERRGESVVVLEGDPRYYGRLGFEPAARFGISINLPSWAPPEAAQVYRLAAYDPAVRGRVVYPAAFDAATEDR